MENAIEKNKSYNNDLTNENISARVISVDPPLKIVCFRCASLSQLVRTLVVLIWRRNRFNDPVTSHQVTHLYDFYSVLTPGISSDINPQASISL